MHADERDVVQHHDSSAGERMSGDLGSGRSQYLAVVGFTLLALLCLAAGVWLRDAEFNPLVQLGRPVAFCGLAFLAYRGAGWARTLLVIWSGLLALTCFVAASMIGFDSPVSMVAMFVFAAGIGYGAFLLATSNAIAAFVTRQRVRIESTPPAV